MNRHRPLTLPLLALAAAVALWWVLPAAWREGARRLGWEVQAPLWALRGDAAGGAPAGDAAVGPALLDATRAPALRAELGRLEGLLRMPPAPGYRLVFGRVVRRDLAAWWSRLQVDRGAGDGLAAGQGVVGPEGVVGRVVEVFAHSATVELVSSPAFRAAATVEGDGRPVIYRGEAAHLGRAAGGGRVSTVATDLRATPAQPLRLVSSRLGGAFPDGLPIGLVTLLEPSGDGLFQEGAVRLPAALAALPEVAVLVPAPPPNGAPR